MLRAEHIFIFVCFIYQVSLKELPDYIKVCKRDQSTINDCVKNSIEALRPNLIAGIPDIDVPSIDPFYIDEVVAINGDLAPIKAAGKGITISGAGNFTIKSVEVDVNTLDVQVQIRFRRLHVSGQYQIDTQILLIPIRGQGDFNTDIVKCDAKSSLKGDIYEVDGTQYLRFKNMTIDLTFKDYRIQLNGLFNGDKTLEEATNQALNQNRDEIMKTIKPYIENTAAKVLLDSANKIVNDIPLNTLLPPP